MSAKLTRRFLLTGLAVSLAGTAWASPPLTSLRPQMRGPGLRQRAAGDAGRLVAKSGLSGVTVFAVADVRSGEVLESMDGQTGLPPASVAKALTAMYAIETLGLQHRFATRLVGTGSLNNGVLSGDLILVGGGDPTLDTNGLADMAQQLKAAGVREVRGDFKVYSGAFPYVRAIDPGQPDHVGYSPAVAGISLNFNRVHFEWKRASGSYAVSMDARSNRYRPDVQMAKMRVIKRSVPIYTYEQQGSVDTWTVASGALGSGGARWLPVRDPAAYAGDVFRTLARSGGLVLGQAKVTRRLPPGARTYVQHTSAPLGNILKDMLKYSTNLTAEMVGLSATVARGVKPAGLKASAGEMSRWAAQRFGMTGTRLVDHSGLGGDSRMTAQDLVKALSAARQNAALRPILKPFTMRNAKGQVIKSHPIKVDAKTGTLNFVSGLGGYMTARDGTELAFAIFTADVPRRERIPRHQMERPEGARTWNRRSKSLQQKLIERWGALYGS